METLLTGMFIGLLVCCFNSRRNNEKPVLVTNTCKIVKLKEEELPLTTSLYICGRFIECKIVVIKCESSSSFDSYYVTLHTKSTFFNAWLNSCMMDDLATKEDVSIGSLGIKLYGVFPSCIQRTGDGSLVTLSVDYLGDIK